MWLSFRSQGAMVGEMTRRLEEPEGVHAAEEMASFRHNRTDVNMNSQRCTRIHSMLETYMFKPDAVLVLRRKVDTHSHH